MQLRFRRRAATAGVAGVTMALALAACSSSSTTSSTTSSSSSPAAGSSSTAAGSSSSSAALSGTLNGSGSTFQLTYQQAAISAFKSVQPGMTVNYGGGGSGKGRTDLASGTVNYAGSDSTIPSAEQANFNGKTVLYFPVLIGPISVAYNLSGVTTLKLTPDVLANIFQGKITSWNNSAITAINPGVSLPSTPITIAVRSDSSGTTQNFSLFLEKAAPSTWTLGSSSTIKWPSTARAGNGNGGVAQIVKSTPGAIGYVDYADAKATGLSSAEVKNKDGNYVAPSTASATAAADGVTVASNLTFHAVWASGAQAYPITYQSWVLAYETQSSSNNAKMLQAYIGYLLGAGQQLLPELGYAPLPASLDSMAKAQLSKIGM
jgi:phosphate transport system substrate-binding protein